MIVFISGQFLVADTQLYTRGFVPPSVHWFVHGSVRQWCSSRKWEKNEHFRCFVYVCCGGWGVYGHLMPLPYRLQRYNVTSRDLLTNDHSSSLYLSGFKADRDQSFVNDDGIAVAKQAAKYEFDFQLEIQPVFPVKNVGAFGDQVEV